MRSAKLSASVRSGCAIVTARFAPRLQCRCAAFVSDGLGLAGGADFCAGATPVFTAAQCARTGVTAAQYGRVTVNPANQYNAMLGGNVNLTPEKADTYTVGVVVQPRFVPGLAFTV